MLRRRQNGAPPLLGPPQRLVDFPDYEEEEQTVIPHQTQRAETKLVLYPSGKSTSLCSQRSSASKSRSSAQKSARQAKENPQITSKPLKLDFTRPPRLPLRPRGPASQNSAQNTADPATCSAPINCTPGNNDRIVKTQQPAGGANQSCTKTPSTHPSSFAHQAGTTQTPAESSLGNSAHKRGVANGSINQHKTPSTHPTTASFRQERETATPADCHIAPHLSETGSAGGPRVEQLCSSRAPAIGTHLSEKYEVVEFKHGSEVRRYSKLAILGFGGSSKVFKVMGEDAQLYALKEVYIKAAPNEIKSAYVNEVKLLKKLKNQVEIITLFDYSWDKEQGIIYLLLEHGNIDLGKVLKGSEESSFAQLRSSPAFLHSIWYQMLRIVQVIHREGVIHNDLKPENFVFCGPFLKLIDFGIANKIEIDHTSVERDIRCGTASYMAPETIATQEDRDVFKVGRPADVWSLGCILYQMVYHRTPFEHLRNKMQKWQAITDPAYSIDYPTISCHHTLEVLQWCLQRNPKERPSVEQLISHPIFTIVTIT